MVSPSFESSILLKASVQKAYDALTAATNLSLESLSLSSSTFGAATSAALEQKELLNSTTCTARCANGIWSGVGL